MKIPGMVLPAGTYVFKSVDSERDRTIVQVFSQDENFLYSTFPAIADGPRPPVRRVRAARRYRSSKGTAQKARGQI